MGWSFTYGASRADIIEEVSGGKGIEPRGGMLTHRRRVMGNKVWAIQSNVVHPNESMRNVKFIVLYKLGKESGDWGYKSVSESMGPADKTCPPSFFDEVETPDSEFAAGWRDECRALATEAKRRSDMLTNAKIGDTLVLLDTCTPGRVDLVSKKPLVGHAFGMDYSVQRKLIVSVESRS